MTREQTTRPHALPDGLSAQPARPQIVEIDHFPLTHCDLGDASVNFVNQGLTQMTLA